MKHGKITGGQKDIIRKTTVTSTTNTTIRPTARKGQNSYPASPSFHPRSHRLSAPGSALHNPGLHECDQGIDLLLELLKLPEMK